MCNVCKTGKYGIFDSNLCEAHDVCVSCGIKRKDLTEMPWGVCDGAFKCKPCESHEKSKRIQERIKKSFETEWTDEITCPHCGYEFSDSWEVNYDGKQDCPECEKEFKVEIHHSTTYCTYKG